MTAPGSSAAGEKETRSRLIRKLIMEGKKVRNNTTSEGRPAMRLINRKL
jgi:hypothetical protein